MKINQNKDPCMKCNTMNSRTYDMQNFMLKKNLPLNIRSNIQENGHNKNKSKKIRGSLKKTDRLNSRPSTPHTFFFLKGRKRE
jgi:hypothetical protein